MIYEMLRGWLGAQLSIHPKVITIIGSARIGFSLCSGDKYGSPFGLQSDLDLSIVDQYLFERLSIDFKKWEADYASGASTPRGAGEQKYWQENAQAVPANVARGFIDPYKIPARQSYPTAQRVLDIQSRLARKIDVTESAPKFKRVSTRIYRDWSSFLIQMERNLGFTVQSFSSPSAK